MTAWDDFSGHTKAYAIDETACSDIRASWKILDPHMEDIFAAFYSRWGQEPKLAALVRGRIDHLKTAQYDHWKRLFSARFDQEYFNSVRRVGLAHVRIGLEPHWYIAGYNNVLQQVSVIMGRQARFSGARAARMIAAVTKAAMLDMDIAVSVYGETLIQQISDREERVHAAIDEFDGSINCMLGKLDRMTADLGVSSGELETQAASVTARCDRIRGHRKRPAPGLPPRPPPPRNCTPRSARSAGRPRPRSPFRRRRWMGRARPQPRSKGCRTPSTRSARWWN